MTNRPSAPLSKRILNIIIRIVVIIVIIIGAKLLYRALVRAVTGPRIVASFRATFPNFCRDGQVLAETSTEPLEMLMTDHNNIWAIRCDTWTEVPIGFFAPLPVTFVSLDDCTTIHPIFDITDEHHTEFEAINKSNGKKLAFCP